MEYSSNLSENIAVIGEKYNQIMQKLFEKYTLNSEQIYDLGFAEVVSNLMLKIFSEPSDLLVFQMQYCQEQIKLLSNISEAKTVKDRRFIGNLWEENLFYRYLKQSYFLFIEHMEKVIDQINFPTVREKQKALFFVKQLSYALSPTNYFFTNPEIMEEFYRTDGESLIKGMNNLLADIEKSSKFHSITTSTKDKFVVGENIACTAGEVVFQNELIQLIHYYPKKKDVYQIPLLIIPPWINKYYILDLSPDNSYVSWCLEQGYSVFLISWVNPDGELLKLEFEDYLFKGAIAALDFIEVYCQQKQTSVIGYCLGGTLAVIMMAYLAKRGGGKRIASATLLTTMIDFEESGDFSLFVDDKSINYVEEHLHKQGYLDGSEMNMSFSLLRANDMIWHFYINNYLLGKEPFPFDILYWNSDSTRLPGKMHAYYLRNMYLENNLRCKDIIKMGKTAIDTSKIKTPCYYFATIDDHIAPWHACYRGLKLTAGDNKFILGGSGHVAGVINPPSKSKYYYYENSKDVIDELWIKTAQKCEGSWWSNWDSWQKKYSGKKITASQPKKSIEKAPGSYVKQK
jgi:polyhydroxyalkanoate synthase